MPRNEANPEQSLSKVDSVNIIEVKPEALKQQEQNANPSATASTKFDTVIIRAPGGVSVSLFTENGAAVLSVLLTNLVRSLK